MTEFSPLSFTVENAPDATNPLLSDAVNHPNADHGELLLNDLPVA